MTPIDIRHTANLLLDQHGERAQAVAAHKVVELTLQNDTAGAADWGDIIAAIGQLRLEKRSLGAPGQ